MPKSRSKHRTRRSLDEISALMDQFCASGMSAAAFARRIGVSVPTIYNWRRRVREREGCAAAGERALPPSMVRIIAAADPPASYPSKAAADAGISVVLPGGLHCRIEPGFHAETLERVVELLTR